MARACRQGCSTIAHFSTESTCSLASSSIPPSQSSPRKEITGSRIMPDLYLTARERADGRGTLGDGLERVVGLVRSERVEVC